jgi:hypothetical protein
MFSGFSGELSPLITVWLQVSLPPALWDQRFEIRRSATPLKHQQVQ